MLRGVFLGDRKEIATNLIVIVAFCIIVVVGVLVADDYGLLADEAAQRQHSLVTYDFLNERLFGREVNYIKQLGLPSLTEYSGKTYGVLLQIPCIIIEDAANFSLSLNEIFTIRHLFVYFYHFIALICFYLLCLDLFRNYWKRKYQAKLFALAGMLMLYLFPRFFMYSFYNFKDLTFISLFVISLFFLLQFLKRGRKLLWGVLFTLFCALSTGIRVVGLLLFIGALVFMVIEELVRPRYGDLLPVVSARGHVGGGVRKVIPFVVLPLTFLLFYCLSMPASWGNLTAYLKDVIATSADFTGWNSTMQFNGKHIKKEEMPWYYLPEWMAITVPLPYLFLFLAGLFFLFRGLVIHKFRQFVKDRYNWFLLFLFIIPFLLQIFGFATIYINWHHLFFLMVPFLLLALFGAAQLHRKWKENAKAAVKCSVPVLISVSLLVNAVRIAWNHPFQESTFNIIGVPIASGFDRAVYSTNTVALAHILGNYKKAEGAITIWGMERSFIAMLPKEEQKNVRIATTDEAKASEEYFWYDENAQEKADFYWQNFRSITGNDFAVEGFRQVYIIEIDGFSIGMLLINEKSTVSEKRNGG